jgi:LuxR family transcriptional regulator, maltose regulon positive regulatory protein
MQITHSTRDGCLVVTLTGQITVSTAPQIQRALFKDLADQPSAIVCDLGGVDVLDPVCATVFAAVANHPASRWPATSLLLCGAQPAVAEVLGGLRVRHFLPLYDTLQEAMDAVADRPGYLRDELRLAPTPTAAAAARVFVGETLELWRLGPPDEELSERARLLADELVTNAVVHARTDMRLRLELGGELLHITVRDFDRRLPRLLPDDPRAEGGRGLRLVERIARSWGAQHHPEGGKVVWCTLRTSRLGPSRPAAGAPSPPVLESKLTPPVRRPGMVPRPNALGHLTAASGVPVVALVAPPGYGKTTLLAQWAEQDPRPLVWLSVDQYDNDPARLLTYLAVALDRVEPIDPAVFGALAAPDTSVVATVVPRLGATLAAAAHPLVVVLDDIQLLHDQQCLDALEMLVNCLGDGSQLMVAGRGEPLLPIARLRAEGRVAELGPEVLAMDHHEAAALLRAAEVELRDADIAELVERTEGWPAALYLAALSLQATGTKGGAAAALAGDDRLLAAYLQPVLLSRLSAGTVRFLTRTAVLDRLSGPLCDATLDTTGSAQVLERLEQSNLLVVPLDRHREWYRYHHLFRELLRAELERNEPELVAELILRAAAWCERHGLPEATMDYAMQAGDPEDVAGLVVRLAFPVYYGGRLATLQRWFDWFDDHQLLERHPAVAVLGAWFQALVGRAAAAERWADAAERGAFQEAGPLPDGTASIDGWLALLRAVMCRDGVERLRADAELACRLVPMGSRLRAPAVLLLGISHLLVGDLDGADRLLARAVEVAEDTKATDTAAIALAERALVAIDRGEWDKAEPLVEQARSLLHQAHLDDYVTNALLYAVAARLAAHQGEVARARDDLAHAQRLRPQLTVALPINAVQARLELVKAYLALTDVAGARTVLREVDELLRRRPHLGVLGRQADQLHARVEAMRADVLGASSLTAAELRLLPLLATHLTFREIGERLHVSPHTVKTQAMSIYRKLGVSSRNQAIQHTQQLGLLPA